MNSREYIDAFKNGLLTTLEDHNLEVSSIFLQQDNVSTHCSAVTTAFLHEKSIKTLPWPALSPDMNPIENCWDCLKHRVKARVAPSQTVKELWGILQEEWRQISKQYIATLYNSMPNRVAELKRQRGGNTHY